MLQRQRGEHEANEVVARCHARRQAAAVSPLGHQHDRPRGAFEQETLLLGHASAPPGHIQIGHHYRQRLGDPLLPLPQPAHGGVAGRITHKMKSTEALHGEHVARTEPPAGRLDRGIAAAAAIGPCDRDAAGIMHRRKPHARPAGGAGIRLGMEAAVGGVGVFRGAGRAHRKRRHRRSRPIVGQALDDRKPRATVGAVYEGISRAAVCGIAKLREAGRAGGDVRRHAGNGPGWRRVGLGFEDGKPIAQGRIKRPLLDVNLCDIRQQRPFVTQRRHKRLDRQRGPLHLDHHPAAAVLHKASEAMPLGDPPDKRPKAHPLHGASNTKATADRCHGHARKRNRTMTTVRSNSVTVNQTAKGGSNPTRNSPPRDSPKANGAVRRISSIARAADVSAARSAAAKNAAANDSSATALQSTVYRMPYDFCSSSAITSAKRRPVRSLPCSTSSSTDTSSASRTS